MVVFALWCGLRGMSVSCLERVWKVVLVVAGVASDMV